jgi:hypothetical protein
MATVRQFLFQSYRLIDASNPTIPLHGDDLELGITVLNQLLQYYASSGLLLTIAQTVQIPLSIGQTEVVCGDSTFVPTPDITLGRLANLDSAWLLLDGVTYPLIDESRDEYLASWRYDPLQGLPRFVITFPDVDVVRIRLYPAPSQFFLFNLRGKFQLPVVTSNDTLDSLPQYYQRFFLFAVAKDVAMYKGRADAWTQKLEDMYREAKDIMEGASEVNTTITGDRANLLNGSWRVRAGI